MFKRRYNHEIDPDEILIDASNIPKFDTQQFEGLIERSIPKAVGYSLALICLAVFVAFSGRLLQLQVVHGDEYVAQSEENRLEEEPIFGSRGVIYDRNGVELAWNTDADTASDFYYRAYRSAPGLAHLVGYVSHPQSDARGVYWQREVSGRDGAERLFDSALAGTTGKRLLERDASGRVRSEAVTVPPADGENVTLSIDARIQEELYRNIESVAREAEYAGGAGVIMDIATGEIIALTSYPEYDPELISKGENRAAITRAFSDPRKPFLNRAVAGLYTPGSTVKPYMAYGALAEGVITPERQILSTGQISIPNPFKEGEESVFKDWKAHGLVDMRRALAVSSDVYFYEVGGGFEGQEGLGIDRIDQYMRLFGFGTKTGIDLMGEATGTVPTPEWKERNFDGEKWLLGDTYHTSIGQYGFQVTPVQMVRAVASLASGKLIVPHITLGKKANASDLRLDQEHLAVIREGMRDGVTDQGGVVNGLNVPYVEIAAKTGSAELGVSKQFINSWVEGYFPYGAPRYAFAIVMERGSRTNTIGATAAMRRLVDWIESHASEYFE